MKKSLVEKRQTARKKAIFTLVRGNNNQLSRNDICKLTKFSMTTVSSLVDEWIQEGFLLETESSENRVGRKPTLLAINPGCIYFAGLECSSWGVNFTIIDASQQVYFHDAIHFQRPAVADVLEAMDFIVKRFIQQYPDIWEKVPSLTVSLPGKIDAALGVGISYASVPDWKNVDIRSHFQYLKKDLYFINNADGMLLGYCTKKGIDDNQSVLFMLIRNGTGVRLYSHGRLLSQYNVLCEVGHLRASGSNRLCYCGKRGCFDSEITITAIQNKIQEALSVNRLPGYLKREKTVSDQADIPVLLELVSKGDAGACEIFDGVVRYIGELLCSVMLMFQADTVVLCTELCREKERLRQMIEPALFADEEKKADMDYVLPLDEFSSLGSAIVGYQRYFGIDDDLESDI